MPVETSGRTGDNSFAKPGSQPRDNPPQRRVPGLASIFFRGAIVGGDEYRRFRMCRQVSIYGLLKRPHALLMQPSVIHSEMIRVIAKSDMDPERVLRKMLPREQLNCFAYRLDGFQPVPVLSHLIKDVGLAFSVPQDLVRNNVNALVAATGIDERRRRILVSEIGSFRFALKALRQVDKEIGELTSAELIGLPQKPKRAL